MLSLVPQIRDGISIPRIGPDDGVVERLSRFAIPADGRLSLIGDADAFDRVLGVSECEEGFERSFDAEFDSDEIRERVVFVPALFRVDCRVRTASARVQRCCRESRDVLCLYSS